METREKSGQKIALAIAVLMVLGCLVMWMQKSGEPAQPEPTVAAAGIKQPVTISLLSGEVITQAGQSSGYAAAYYREATAYVSTTVKTGYITYTWQSSPDNTTWFDQEYMAGINASQKISCELGAFGPYVRLSWAASVTPWVTTTVWLAMKE